MANGRPLRLNPKGRQTSEEEKKMGSSSLRERAPITLPEYVTQECGQWTVPAAAAAAVKTEPSIWRQNHTSHVEVVAQTFKLEGTERGREREREADTN